MFQESVITVSKTSLESEVGNVIEFTKREMENVEGLVEEIRKYIIAGCTTWLLCGKKEEKDDYIVLQVASSKDLLKEIAADLNRMLPPTGNEEPWNSYFYKEVLKVKYGRDHISQKYNHMYNSFDYFCVVIADYSKCLRGVDVEPGKEAQYAEAKIACNYRAVYWWPNNSNGESAIVQQHTEWIREIPREWWEGKDGEVIPADRAPKWLQKEYRGYKKALKNMPSEPGKNIAKDLQRPENPVLSRIAKCDVWELETFGISY